MTRKRPYDVVLYGASGFVGRQTVAYFAQHASGLRWALAGRDARKLEKTRGDAEAGVIVADAADDDALAALAAQTSVVLSTAGPFALYGSALVAACVRHGTHYCDITGETPWVREMIDRHHEQAAESGTRLVPCCGFDSVPSDIGALLVADAVKRESGERCVRIKACHSIRGGLNGGTLASLLNIAEAGALEQLADPFLLNPVLNPDSSAPADRSAHADPLAPRHDSDFDAWLAPFVMAAINTRIVRRSVALMPPRGNPYAPGMVYQEYLRTGRGPLGAALAAGMAGGIGVGIVGMRSGVWRAAMRKLLPAPGQGPSERAMNNGSFACELIGQSASGTQVRGRIAGRGDPGNRATTLFVCEAAMALAGDVRKLPGGASRGGVLTPATALGLPYAQRLAQAGITVEPLPS